MKIVFVCSGDTYRSAATEVVLKKKIEDNGIKDLRSVCPNISRKNLNSLKPNEVFVFGSNLAGHHGGGAANAALKKFGANLTLY